MPEGKVMADTHPGTYYDVFISYTGSSQDVVDDLLTAFKDVDETLSCWTMKDCTEDGPPHPDTTRRRILAARMFIAVFTREYLHSSNCQTEFAVADTRNREHNPSHLLIGGLIVDENAKDQVKRLMDGRPYRSLPSNRTARDSWLRKWVRRLADLMPERIPDSAVLSTKPRENPPIDIKWLSDGTMVIVSVRRNHPMSGAVLRELRLQLGPNAGSSSWTMLRKNYLQWDRSEWQQRYGTGCCPDPPKER
jgi:hypothetical protein